MSTSYSIKHAHGLTERGFATLDAAYAAVRSVYRNAEIGHSGDIADGGESTFCWADAEDADAGRSAVCTIRASHEVVQ